MTTNSLDDDTGRLGRYNLNDETYALRDMGIQAREKRIHFAEGLIGLSNCKDFRLRSSPELEPFEQLQCVAKSEVGFLVLDPTWVVSEFDHAISAEDWARIGSPDPLARQVFVIATIGQSLEDSTANFLAPLIINPEQALGRQVILSHSDFTVDRALAAATTQPLGRSLNRYSSKVQYVAH